MSTYFAIKRNNAGLVHKRRTLSLSLSLNPTQMLIQSALSNTHLLSESRSIVMLAKVGRQVQKYEVQ